MHVVDAVLAFVVAMALAVALTPLAKRLAVRLGAMAQPNERGLAQIATPQWGGRAILIAVLVAGLCAIDGIAFAVIAFDLGVGAAGTLAALTAGAAIGFLFYNFHPASIFMGDSGANLLGYLLGVATVIGSFKTNAVVALIVPLFILAVPFLDTSFVVAKRLKYHRKPWSADDNHFHHRM